MIMGLAPMDGITNAAYRIVVKQIFEKYNKEHELWMWTEFMNAEGYVREPQRLVHHIIKTDYEDNTIAQIYGGDHEDLVKTAKDIAEKYPSFSGIELNIGCPSPKVMACGGGAGMMREKEKTLELMKRLRDVCGLLPFSMKTRAGLTEDDKQAQKEFIIASAEFCQTLSIHGRTYKQGHSGDVDWQMIYDIKEAVGDKALVIGNGGVKSYEHALELKHNLDGIMIAQAAIADPWIFVPHEPTPAERRETILFHLKLMIIAFDYYHKNLHFTEKFTQPSYEQWMNEVENFDISRYDVGKSVIEYRKYLFNYVGGLTGSKEFKRIAATIRDYQPLVDAVNEFFATLS